jgi:hypothetical protein
MTTEPYSSARRVSWVADNGSSHRGQAAARRLQGAWPTLRLVHLPIHTSWLNQIEVYFSVIQRKLLTPTTSAASPEAEAGLLPADRHAVPVEVHHADLDLLLKLLAAHKPASALAARPPIRHRNSVPEHLGPCWTVGLPP